MAHEERPKTKAAGEKKRREDSALRFDALRFLPNGFKLPYVLHAIGRNKTTQKERSQGTPERGFSC